jgi:molybdate transport system regulatory protein
MSCAEPVRKFLDSGLVVMLFKAEVLDFIRFRLSAGRTALNFKHKIWLEHDGEVIFGPGRDKLLRAIEECHSLSAAAKKLKMSYRAAWGRLKASEARLGIRLVETDHARQGMHLTEEAKKLIECFDQLDREITDILNKAPSRLP